jgi:hypothetical protein
VASCTIISNQNLSGTSIEGNYKLKYLDKDKRDYVIYVSITSNTSTNGYMLKFHENIIEKEIGTIALFNHSNNIFYGEDTYYEDQTVINTLILKLVEKQYYFTPNKNYSKISYNRKMTTGKWVDREGMSMFVSKFPIGFIDKISYDINNLERYDDYYQLIRVKEIPSIKD